MFVGKAFVLEDDPNPAFGTRVFRPYAVRKASVILYANKKYIKNDRCAIKQTNKYLRLQG